MQSNPALHTSGSVTSVVALYCPATFVRPSIAQFDLELFDQDVLSASRLIQPITSAPSFITVNDGAMTRLSATRPIVDILRLTPVFQVTVKFPAGASINAQVPIRLPGNQGKNLVSRIRRLADKSRDGTTGE